MLERARGFPGFVDFRHYVAEDGERLSVVWWQDEVTLRQWRMDEQHLEAQRRGRSEWYEFYRIETAEVLRVNEFSRT
jgi:heme-degrading monooxygenase HmoA